MTEFYKTISKPLDNPDLRVLSLGVGVQSSTLAVMAARGDIGPMPDCAIFSDTGWEPQYIYDYLEYIRPLLPFPIHQVSEVNFDNAEDKGQGSFFDECEGMCGL